MATLLHLLAEDDWLGRCSTAPTSTPPPSLAEEGFVHCTPRTTSCWPSPTGFYANAAGRVRRALDRRDRAAAEVRWEPPSPPPPGGSEALFPHVYGPLDLAAVVDVRRVERRRDGTFVGFSAYEAELPERGVRAPATCGCPTRRGPGHRPGGRPAATAAQLRQVALGERVGLGRRQHEVGRRGPRRRPASSSGSGRACAKTFTTPRAASSEEP